MYYKISKSCDGVLFLKFEILSRARLRATLEKDELSGYGLSFDTMSAKDVDTREMLDDVLSIAEARTGFRKGSEQTVYVKVLPTEKGCEIYFTLLSEENARQNEQDEPFIYFTENAETAFTAAGKRFELGGEAALYSQPEGGYIFIESTGDCAGRMILSEYCRLAGKGRASAAAARERGNLIFMRVSEALKSRGSSQ